MDEIVKIFISSRQKELEQERTLAKKAVEEIGKDLGKHLIPVLIEHKAAPPSTTILNQCLDELKGCKAVICIYCKTISEIVKNEFRWANERGIPIFIFKKEPNKNDEADEKLKKFIKEEAGSPLGEGPYERYVYKAFIGEDIKDKIKASLKEHYPFNKAIPEKYLPSAIESGESERLERIGHVYVKPRCYLKAEEILKSKHILIITGPAHLGKTSMGFYMADSLQKNNICRRFLTFPEGGDIYEIANYPDSVILFDDPFGGSMYHTSFMGDRFNLVQGLARKNYIIITSRREVLHEAIKNTKLGEKNLEDIMIEMTQKDYRDKDFRAILERHLEYFRAGRDVRELSDCHKREILRELRFPHNYEVLIGEELARVIRGEKDFWQALEDAKEIEKAVGKWFEAWCSKDKEIFCYLLTLTLCGELGEKDFVRFYKKAIKRLNTERKLGLPIPGNLTRLRKVTPSYVSQSGPLRLEHPSYEEGIMGRIKSSFSDEAMLILKEMAHDARDWKDRAAHAMSLGKYWEYDPWDDYDSEASVILKSLANDKDPVVRSFGKNVLSLGIIPF